MIVTAGVYALTCTSTGEQYIGSTIALGQRKRQHAHALRAGIHKSTRLQQAWERFGARAFKFRVLLVCRPEDRHMYEQLVLDAYRPAFNRSPTATSSRGVAYSDETKERLKQRPQSSARRHLVDGQLLTVPELAEKYGVTPALIYSRLRAGVTGVALVERRRGDARLVEINGELLTLRQAASRAGLPVTTIHSRISYGVTGADLLAPRQHGGGRRKKGITHG